MGILVTTELMYGRVASVCESHCLCNVAYEYLRAHLIFSSHK
jgi:hypothetical protein